MPLLVWPSITTDNRQRRRRRLPVNPAPVSPDTWVEATLARPACRIRVCSDSLPTVCPSRTQPFTTLPGTGGYISGADGYLIDGNLIEMGTELWTTALQMQTDQYRRYLTNGQPQIVDADAFLAGVPGEMTLLVSPRTPLQLFDLDVTAEWYVQSDPQTAARLAESFRFGRISSMTGQRVRRRWASSQCTSRVMSATQRTFWSMPATRLRPNAIIGGSVSTPTLDVSPGISITYQPGKIYMGSY